MSSLTQSFTFKDRKVLRDRVLVVSIYLSNTKKVRRRRAILRWEEFPDCLSKWSISVNVYVPQIMTTLFTSGWVPSSTHVGGSETSPQEFLYTLLNRLSASSIETYY